MPNLTISACHWVSVYPTGHRSYNYIPFSLITQNKVSQIIYSFGNLREGGSEESSPLVIELLIFFDQKKLEEKYRIDLRDTEPKFY